MFLEKNRGKKGESKPESHKNREAVTFAVVVESVLLSTSQNQTSGWMGRGEKKGKGEKKRKKRERGKGKKNRQSLTRSFVTVRNFFLAFSVSNFIAIFSAHARWRNGVEWNVSIKGEEATRASLCTWGQFLQAPRDLCDVGKPRVKRQKMTQKK